MQTTSILEEILSYAKKIQASDIHLKSGSSPVFRRDGALVSMKAANTLRPEDMNNIALTVMNSHHKVCFEEEHQVELAYQARDGRYRVSVFSQNGSIAMAFRAISMDIPTLEQLGLSEVSSKLAMSERGLVLVTGATGSGKSTTLASMVDHINRHRACHIITIEDPIEYIHFDRRSLVNQRELGLDCLSFDQGLSGALRQDPDVIMVGELRSRDSIEMALTAAETGHTVLASMHCSNAREAIIRIVSSFPDDRKGEIRLLLSQVLAGIFCQRLVPRADSKGMVLALEILVATSRIRSSIRDESKDEQIKEAMEAGLENYGMQTFDQSLMKLYEQKLITQEEAVRQATNSDDFLLRLKGVY
jgi:twitching motility protein PilT